jgi:hypothetical protein
MMLFFPNMPWASLMNIALSSFIGMRRYTIAAAMIAPVDEPQMTSNRSPT